MSLLFLMSELSTSSTMNTSYKYEAITLPLEAGSWATQPVFSSNAGKRPLGVEAQGRVLLPSLHAHPLPAEPTLFQLLVCVSPLGNHTKIHSPDSCNTKTIMFSFSGTTSFSWTMGIMQLVGEHLSGGQSQISSWPDFSQVTEIPLPPPKGLAGIDQGLQRHEHSSPFVHHCWPSCCQYSPYFTSKWISSWLQCTTELFSFCQGTHGRLCSVHMVTL